MFPPFCAWRTATHINQVSLQAKSGNLPLFFSPHCRACSDNAYIKESCHTRQQARVLASALCILTHIEEIICPPVLSTSTTFSFSTRRQSCAPSADGLFGLHAR